MHNLHYYIRLKKTPPALKGSNQKMNAVDDGGKLSSKFKALC